MSRRPFTLILALALSAGLACENAPSWGEDRGAADAVVPADLGPTAAYDRLFLFLGPGTRLPTAAVFDFSALADSARVLRGVRGRVVDGTGWVQLLDAGWEMEAMREPWRLVPHGPIKILVGDAGEASALVFRGDPAVRLELGPPLSEYSPDAGTQLVLRQGRLSIDGTTVTGVLLDAQLGRAVNPEFLARREAEDAPPAAEASDGAVPDGGEAPDSVPGDPTPTARPGAEALLVDNTGYYAVFAASGSGPMAWLYGGGREDVRRGGRLEPASYETFESAGTQFPNAWRIVAPGAELTGELQADAADRAALVDLPELSALGYVVVSGWIEDRGVRRDVFGLVRHVR